MARDAAEQNRGTPDRHSHLIRMAAGYSLYPHGVYIGSIASMSKLVSPASKPHSRAAGFSRRLKTCRDEITAGIDTPQTAAGTRNILQLRINTQRGRRLKCHDEVLKPRERGLIE